MALPCNVTPFTPDDSVSLILWYRNDSIKPLYTVDARDISLDRASHSIDDSLQSRVVFHINYPLGYLKISPVQERDATEYRQVLFKWGNYPDRIETIFFCPISFCQFVCMLLCCIVWLIWQLSANHLYLSVIIYRCRVDFKRGRTVNRVLTLDVIGKSFCLILDNILKVWYSNMLMHYNIISSSNTTEKS